MSRIGPSFIIIILYILVIALRSARKPKGSATSAGNRNTGSQNAAPRTAPRDRPVPTIPSLSKKNSQKDDCEYGEINHSYSHTSEKRVAQLNGYLEAGLIDKKEYAQMLERYTRQDQIYDNSGY